MTDDERRAIEWECTRLINLYANLNDEARWEEVGGALCRGRADDPADRARGADRRARGPARRLPRPGRRGPASMSSATSSSTSESEDAASAKSVILLFTGKDGAASDRHLSRPLRAHRGRLAFFGTARAR